MVFPKEEKRNSSKKTHDDYKKQLAKMFNNAKSIEEFKVNANLLGAPKRMCMPFLLYYYARNLSLPITYAIIMVTSILMTIMLCCIIEYKYSLGGYRGATYAGFVIGSTIGTLVYIGPFKAWYGHMERICC